MTHDSFRPLIGALTAAVVLAACSSSAGGVGATPDVLGAQQALQAQGAPQTIRTIRIAVDGTPAIGRPGTYRLRIVAQGVGGTVIAGAYSIPISLTNSDTSGATRLTATSVPNSSTAVSLIYSGLGGSSLGGFEGATIAASSGLASGQVTFLSSGSQCVTLTNIGGYYPCDLRSAYSLPSTIAGTGQTVALVDAYDDPKAEADLNVYRSEFGLPPCTTANQCFRKVNQSGVAGKPPAVDTTGWSVEESLDLDMVSAICPRCHIVLVEANSAAFSDLGSAADAAARLGASQISNSYGAPEFVGENLDDVYYRHPHAVVVVSAGDNDYGAEYPAASPYVTAVGGTSLSAGANGRGWGEIVWNNENVQGTGSGCSAYEPKPSWQKDPGCATRMVSDVAAVADPYTGVAIYDSYIVPYVTQGGWEVAGGTSAAAPIIAAVYALGGASPTSLDYASRSYARTGQLNDIVTGADGGCGTISSYFCTAEVGYDGPTGNGTPNGIGGFGGPDLGSARSIRDAAVSRHALQSAIGTRTIRVCGNPKPGSFACDAILVMKPR
jgi:Subtilase family